MKKILFIFSYLLGGIWFSNNDLSAQAIKPGPSIQASYFGGYGVYPGMKVGMEFSLLSKEKYRTRRSRERVKTKEIFTTANLGGYVHPQNNAYIFLNGEIGYRKIRNNGFKKEVLLGLGYLRAIHLPKTYELGSDTAPNEVNFAGQGGIMPSIAIGFGWDYRHKDIPIAWHIRPTLAVQTPYNHSVLLHPAVEVGISYRLK